MTATPPPAPSSGWTVTAQTPTQGLGPAGHFVPGMNVSFITGAGIEGTVFVPQLRYSPENVAAAIAAQAAGLDAVTGLSSPPSS